MMLRLAENATKYAGEIIGGGQKTPTEYQTQKRWKTYWDDGSHKWNYDHHFDDDYD
jgi:hypothetical protein